MGRNDPRSVSPDVRDRERDRERERGRDKDDRRHRHRSRSRDGRDKRYDESDDDYDRRKRRRTRSKTPDRDEECSRPRKHRSRSRDDDRKKFVPAARNIGLTLILRRRKREKSEERKARKAEKKRVREEEEARQVAELSVYSATDNPFHDVNLGQQFRWHKKNEKERKQGLTLAEAQRKDAIRRQEAKEELERLNKRRAEREVEQRLREEEEIRMQRLAESAQMADWLAKEEDFQLEQERTRAAIRIKEKRAKAIDFLALNLRYVNPISEDNQEVDDEELEIDLDEPYNILDVRDSLFLFWLRLTHHALEPQLCAG